MHSRVGFLLACTKRRSSYFSTCSTLLSNLFSSNSNRNIFAACHRRILIGSDVSKVYYLPDSNFRWLGQPRGFCRYPATAALEQFSDDEYECDYENHPASSSVANIDEWKWKLSLLLRNEKDQEVVSRDKRDRRDYEQICNLAKRMGLYSEIYGKVVVVSKVPLPNYRPDLDDKRPQREVVIPLSLQRRVEGLLQEHIDRTQLISGKAENILDGTNSSDMVEDVNLDENPDSFLDGSVMEKVLQRRSLRMRNMQRAWQESPDGNKMLEFRKSLPAFKEKERLLQAIARNQVVVISGETGCGKTTQLPQYILESEIESGRGAFCSIICTQPRRISALAVAERVATERGEPLGDSVGYKVRLEGVKGKNTHLLFCTSGILLRRLLSDRNLDGITHVFVDEIHERGMNEDFLLIVLKDLLPRRPDLRLILMSATLNAELFSSYFGGAPMIHIPGFTYPVRAHFLEDLLEITGYKLTSFNQIDDYGQEKMWKTQKQLAPRKKKNQITALVEDALNKSNFESYSARARDSLACWAPDCIGFNLIEAVLCHICRKERPGAVLVFMTGWEDISCLRDQLKAHPLLGDPNRVLLLTCHGSMATSEQKLIFEKAPQNVRKIVLATNMAEASITINDVVFVVDCGKAKETTYDALNNTPCLLPSWISQASARQRRGRAGRVQPGECYHLYPRCVYEAFAEYQLPELLRTPLNSLCLQIKSLQVGSIAEFLSAALQPPEPLAVQNAIQFLKMIGALDENEYLTHLGKFLAILPVDPKLGKMLIMGAIFRCFDPVLTIVAGLSVRDPFLLPQDKKDLAGTAKSRFSAKDYSDHMALVRAYEGWKDAEREGSAYEYCWRNFLSAQTLQAIHSLRKQFIFILKDAGLLDADTATNNKLSYNQSLVRAVICSGLYPGIASVVHRETSMSFKTMDDGQVLLYANSVNARYQTIPYPWLVFGEKVKVNTVFIRDSTGVSDSIVILFGSTLGCGDTAGHLKMLSGYIEFFMDPTLADCYIKLKEELEMLLQKKLQDPEVDIHKEGKYLMLAVQELVSGDQCEGRFVFGRENKRPKDSKDTDRFTRDGTNPKSLLQTLMMRAGHSPPKYKTNHSVMAPLRILLCGDVLGRLNQLFKRVSSVNKSAGPFDALFCVGQFFPDSIEGLEEFNGYIEGRSSVPIPTYFIGDYGVGSPKILSEVLKDPNNQGFKMEGFRVCENLFWLKSSGKFELHGLSVAYLSGRRSPTGAQFGTYSQDDVDALRALAEDPGTVDIFLTNEWPSGVTNGVTSNIPSEISDSSDSDPTVSELVAEIKPRYHVAGTMGVYFDRQPYANVDALHVTRFLGLAPVGNKDKQKFIHAISPTPASTMSKPELRAKPPNTTLSPYTNVDKAVPPDGATKRPGDSTSESQYWRYDVSQKRQKHGDGNGDRLCFKFVSSGSCPREKCHFRHDEEAMQQYSRGVCFDFLNKGKCERGPNCNFKHSLQEEGGRSATGAASSHRSRECWFCLSSPNVESHLITSVGEYYYCALAKGPLLPDHALIMPIEHMPNTLSLSQECEKELEHLQNSFRAYFKRQGKEAIFFEWAFKRGIHANLQVVPIPSSRASLVQDIFNLAAEKLGFKFTIIKEGRQALRTQFDRSCSLFYVEVPGGGILSHVVEENEKFPVQFGREVLAGLLNVADRADWRNCKDSKEEEIKMVERFKSGFQEYDPNQ